MKTFAVLFALTIASVSFSVPAAAAECSHPYFPAKTGTTWAFKDSNGSQNVMLVTGVEGSKIKIDVKIEAKKETEKGKSAPAPTEVSLEAECTAEGVRMNLSGFQVKGLSGAEMKTISQSGYSLAPASKLKPGATWTEEVTSSMSATDSPVQMKMASKTVHTVIGTEKVKVPAGEFEAVKIEGNAERTMTMEGPMAAMMPKQPPVKGKSTTWLVKGIGVVKTENTLTDAKGQPQVNVSELVRYSIGK